jgi:peptidyl-tRNA hydrolase, PTH1 family
VKVIVGLGNPGREYARTPHNMGFLAIEGLAGRLGCTLRTSWRVPARLGKAQHEGRDLVLVEPRTYMNRSGAAVAPVLRQRGLGPEALLVLVDDADLPLGTLRIRRKGSSGGHKGLRSIAEALGSEEFERIRIGIGRGTRERELVEHVLSPFSAREWAIVEETCAQAAEAALYVVEHGADAAMNEFNRRPGPAAGEHGGGGQSE